MIWLISCDVVLVHIPLLEITTRKYTSEGWGWVNQKYETFTNNFFNLDQYMHETYLNNMKVKACMKIVDTIFDRPKTHQNEKVKLGWG